jgi:hypothetical protein
MQCSPGAAICGLRVLSKRQSLCRSVPKGELNMLGRLSIICVVAAILMIPTALSAQVGGAVSPGVHVGGAVTPALPFAAPSSEVSLAPISGLGARRVRITVHHKHKTTKPRR